MDSGILGYRVSDVNADFGAHFLGAHEHHD